MWGHCVPHLKLTEHGASTAPTSKCVKKKYINLHCGYLKRQVQNRDSTLRETTRTPGWGEGGFPGEQGQLHRNGLGRARLPPRGGSRDSQQTGAQGRRCRSGSGGALGARGSTADPARVQTSHYSQEKWPEECTAGKRAGRMRQRERGAGAGPGDRLGRASISASGREALVLLEPGPVLPDDHRGSRSAPPAPQRGSWRPGQPHTHSRTASTSGSG